MDVVLGALEAQDYVGIYPSTVLLRAPSTHDFLVNHLEDPRGFR